MRTTMMMNASSSSSSTIKKLSSFPSCTAFRVAATARNCGKRSFLRVSAEQQQRYETSADASSSSSSSSLLVHTVAPGDSLYGVAMQYDVDPRDLIVRFSLFCLSSSPFLKRKRTRLCAQVKFSNSFFFFEFDSCVDSNTKNVREYCNIDVVVLSFFLSFAQAANAKTLGGFEYVLPGQRLVVPGRYSRGGGGGLLLGQQQQKQNAAMKNLAPSRNEASYVGEGEERQQQQQQQRQQQQQGLYKNGNISSGVVAGQQQARMPTIVTAVSFVFGLAFGLFLFSRERE